MFSWYKQKNVNQPIHDLVFILATKGKRLLNQFMSRFQTVFFILGTIHTEAELISIQDNDLLRSR